VTEETYQELHVKMKKLVIFLAGAVCLGMMFLSGPNMSAQQSNERVVRIAELEIDPAHLNAYKAALRQEIEASIQKEAGDHFKKYKSETANMVKSLRLIETEPILLGAK
jgi:outer membrane murein-binding lipoprotein Lpp